jgi:hypothetical protein
MDVQSELEQPVGNREAGQEPTIGGVFEPTAPVESGPSPARTSADPAESESESGSRPPYDELGTTARPLLQEASFLVVESGRIRFFVRPRVEVEEPASLEDVQRFSFTLAPRNRGEVRRVSVGKKRMPDTRLRERQWAYVDRVGSAAHVVSDLGPRRYTTKTRGVRNQGGLIEIACGTYAIASHRDHVHLMYELDTAGPSTTDSGKLLGELRIAPRASYIAAVFNPESRWRVRERERLDEQSSEPLDDGLKDRFGKRRFTPLDPVFLDHEGTELVLIGGGMSESDHVTSWARS